MLAVGTDDGLIQVSMNDGKSWSKTEHFPGVPDTTYVSRVAWSAASPGRLYASFDGHRSNDFAPYVLVSEDYGKSWKSISGNLPAMSGVEVVREDPRQPNLLFTGTEFGAFFSTDRGGHWSQLTGNFPAVPVWDMKIQARENDLVLATHGRGIWIMDDITPLEQLAEARAAKTAYLFPVRDELLFQPDNTHNSGMTSYGFEGENPPYGAIITYLLARRPDSGRGVKLDILDAGNTVVRTLPLTGGRQDGGHAPLHVGHDGRAAAHGAGAERLRNRRPRRAGAERTRWPRGRRRLLRPRPRQRRGHLSRGPRAATRLGSR